MGEICLFLRFLCLNSSYAKLFAELLPRKGESAMPHRLANERGFTLTELLVVVGIIVLLTAIVVPNIVGRIDKAKMHAAEDQISEIETALAAYYADFGTYPGDVYPTEDINNNGILEDTEDIGVDVDGNGTSDYACDSSGDPLPNGRLDHGDGVVNIDDLEWALKTTAKHGPYLKEIPLDPWGNKYVYYAPFDRPTDPANFLYIDPTTLRSEEGVGGGTVNGKLDGDTKPRNSEFSEDAGIGQYATTSTSEVEASFVGKWAGRDNGILDHGDDDNKDGNIWTYYTYGATSYPGGGPTRNLKIELGNADVSPDGLARDVGYYIYSIGRNKKDETATGYEDIGGIDDKNFRGTPDNFLNMNYTSNPTLGDQRLWVFTPEDGTGTQETEDLDGDQRLDTGYEDTGIDGIPGTKDRGEGDGLLTVTDPDAPSGSGQPDEEFGTKNADAGGPTTWHYNKHHPEGKYDGEGFDIGGDDINSWNKQKPWRKHSNYGG
jgi:prepilin-type N-terminal cleavage/methylation domain-containing protein